MAADHRNQLLTGEVSVPCAGGIIAPISEPASAPRRRSYDVASVTSGSCAPLDSVVEAEPTADSAGLAGGYVHSGRSSLDVDPSAGPGPGGAGGASSKSVAARSSAGLAGVTFNRSAARARARGLRPSMELRRKKLDFSALQARQRFFPFRAATADGDCASSAYEDQPAPPQPAFSAWLWCNFGR